MTIPKRLRDRLEKVGHSADLAQEPMAWKAESWLKRLPKVGNSHISLDYDALIEGVRRASERQREGERPLIGREDVSTLAVSSGLISGECLADEEAVVTTFLASMIWGYGMTGYGPYRTERILTRGGAVRDATVAAQLSEVAEEAYKNGGVAAFDHVASCRRTSRSYLKYLGPAFGTKFIYFLTKESPHLTTPVMDSVVTGWLQRNAPDSGKFNLSWWDTESYRRYVDLLHAWAGELSSDDSRIWDADDVELLIFEDARGKAPLGPDSENVTAESMLDDLGTEADARAGERDRVGVLLVEALREWFALNPSVDI